jgi:hypothetical protein
VNLFILRTVAVVPNSDIKVTCYARITRVIVEESFVELGLVKCFSQRKSTTRSVGILRCDKVGRNINFAVFKLDEVGNCLKSTHNSLCLVDQNCCFAPKLDHHKGQLERDKRRMVLDL